jgi:hypothetical protein
MADDKKNLQQVLEAIQHLSAEERRQLLDQLAAQLEAEAYVVPLALSGTWAGISLSAQEIDEARRECWSGLIHVTLSQRCQIES